MRNRQTKKTLEKGEYLQGSNAALHVAGGPAQGGEAGGVRTPFTMKAPERKSFGELKIFIPS